MYRLLGLLSDFEDGQTYEWTAEVPQEALQSPDPSKVDFPFKPSAGASHVFTAQSPNAMVCGWSLPALDDLEAQFQQAWSAQGFSGRLWSKQDGKFFYLLRRGDTRLLAVLQSAGEKNTISLMKLDKI